jgi:hypothetical protein
VQVGTMSKFASSFFVGAELTTLTDSGTCLWISEVDSLSHSEFWG